jgi:GntR family transcriptional regulator
LRLRLPARSDVFKVRRVYSLDGIPTALTLLVLAGHKVEGIERHVMNNRSVYGVMREHYGLEISRSERWFEVTMSTPEQASLLAIPHPSPGLTIESIGMTKEGLPLEYYHTFYNTSCTRIHVTSHSRASDSGP